ncbi:putative ferulic acid Esterase/Feruloyl esterase, partial [Aureobasidium melanogenum]
MRTSTSIRTALLATVVTKAAADCSSASIQALLPSIAKVDFVFWQPGGSTFSVPNGDIAYPVSPTNLAAHCAVQIRVTNGTSQYGFGMFLPDDWNGRFLAVGNGGYAGGINWLDMGGGLGYGFAVMSTDTGHNSTAFDGTWAYGQKDKLKDWGYRAMHGSTVLGKQLTQGYYGYKPKYSYYKGCSTGGRQGLRDIQLYPEDFDGVVAGAPAWFLTHMSPFTLKAGTYNLPINASTHIPDNLFPVINAEVLRQCDPVDGVKDNIVSDPQACNFNMDALVCTPKSNQSECLTAPQLTTLFKIYSDYVETNDTWVFPHYWKGSELGWDLIFGAPAPGGLGVDYVTSFMQYGPNWKWQDYDYSIVENAERLRPGNATADDYNLEPFKRHGGKLLIYHGMADQLIPTGSSLYLYSQILRELAPRGIELDDFFRFFLVPGMGHCSGNFAPGLAPWYFAGGSQVLTPGTYGVPGFRDAEHDVLLAMMQWVEHGVAPNQIIATTWHNDTMQDMVLRQRPLCMYPKQQRYIGGDVDKAASWSCA